MSADVAPTDPDPRPRLLRRRRELLGRASGAAKWTLVIAACYGLSAIGAAAHIPAPELVLPLLAGVLLAVTGIVESPFPDLVRRPTHALVGVIMGSYLQPDTFRSVAAAALPLIMVTAATLVISTLAAVLLAHTGTMSLTDAVLSMAPGGSAAIIASAQDLGADARHVAFAQYLRVAFVALTAPAVAVGLEHTGPGSNATAAFGWRAFEHLVEKPQGVSSVLVLTAICLLGIRLGEALRLPSPILLGPMLLAAVVTLTHTWDGYAPAGPFQKVLFAIVGLEVGLRFTRDALRHTATVAPWLLTAIVGVCLLCGALAWAAAAITGVAFVQCYLATTPGGINAVLVTAVATNSDVPLISTIQSVRLFVVVLGVPPLIRWITRRQAAATAEHGPKD